ncbi:hypothetical protein Tsp_15755 [Trichinella spiralis]|uniref:hypothetical protein n=1 Tax=Trichinella spiralis TaxID=6334 RepID=UPI0001EFD2C8|nr:hypothetical protein Tsp_15755 [Trichinella spiralis]
MATAAVAASTRCSEDGIFGKQTVSNANVRMEKIVTEIQHGQCFTNYSHRRKPTHTRCRLLRRGKRQIWSRRIVRKRELVLNIGKFGNNDYRGAVEPFGDVGRLTKP